MRFNVAICRGSTSGGSGFCGKGYLVINRGVYALNFCAFFFFFRLYFVGFGRIGVI